MQKRPSYPLLLVDDDELWLHSFSTALTCSGLNNLITCRDPGQVMEILSRQPVELVLLDMQMNGIPGDDLLGLIKAEHPGLPVIMVTATEELETAVRCMQLGAANYLVKSTQKSQLVAIVHQTLIIRELERENGSLRKSLLGSGPLNQGAFRDIVTADQTMRQLFKYMEAIAESREPILITGETGVGKELVARSIHSLSRQPGELVAVNVAGLDDEAFSDTLFGHVRGAFTGAVERRGGLIERAEGGTLFLDEIGDLSITSQVKLLRLLQEGEYLPLGADAPKRCFVRVVVATHRDLLQMQREGRFRKDLYYRLHTHRVELPPLRERPADLPLLFHHFLDEACKSFGKQVPFVPREILDTLARYPFPGNVRELRSMVHDAVGRMAGGELPLTAFQAAMQSAAKGTTSAHTASGLRADLFIQETVLPSLREAQEMLIAEALRRTNGNQAAAAHLLGITRQALNQRLGRKQEQVNLQSLEKAP